MIRTPTRRRAKDFARCAVRVGVVLAGRGGMKLMMRCDCLNCHGAADDVKTCAREQGFGR